MRPIHRAQVDKERYVLLLTPYRQAQYMSSVVVAPIFTGTKRYRTQIEVGTREGLAHDSVIKCESIANVDTSLLGERVGDLAEWREPELRDAITDAFALQPYD